MTSRSERMRILGVDPGKKATGLAVVEVGGRGRPVLVDWKIVDWSSRDNMPSFLARIQLEVAAFCELQKVAAVALEHIRMHRGTAGLVHSEIRGVSKAGVYGALGASVLVVELGTEWLGLVGLKTNRLKSKARKKAHAKFGAKLFKVEGVSIDAMEAALVAYALSKKMEVEA